MVGTTLGRVLFPEDGAAASGPRLSDLKITGASYGAPIPKIYGTLRLAGNIIWASSLRSKAVTSSSGGGGKGGASGGGQTTGYAYFTSFAVAIAEGEIARLLKIWADGKVIYDASAAGEVIAADLRFRFYGGDEAQLPDSIIEATEGVGNVPAYRGLSYLVFDDLPLAPYGNRIPNIEVLVATDGLGAYPLTDSAISAVTASSFAYDADRGLAYSYEVVGGVDVIRKIDALTLEELASAGIGSEFPRLPDATRGLARDRKGVFWIGTGAAVLAGRQIHRVDGEAMILLGSADLTDGVGAVTFSTDIVNPLTSAQFQVAGSQQSYQVVIFDESLEVVETIPTASRVCTGAVTDEEEVAWVAMSGWATGPVVSDLQIVRVSVFGSPDVDGTGYAVTSDIHTIATADLTPLGGTGSETNNITRLVGYLPATNELVFQNDYRLFKWSTVTETITTARDVSDLSGDLSLVHTHNGSELVLISAGRYAVYLSAETLEERERVDLHEFDGVAASVNGIYDAATDSLIAFNGDFGVKRLFLRRASGASADLAAIVSDLCGRAGLAAGDIDVTALDAGIPGYVVNRPMPVSEALTPLSHYGFFDAVESGYKLNFIPRNSADSGIVLDHSAMLAPLDPADVVTVGLGGGVASARLMQSRLGADITLEAEAVTLAPLSYSSALSGEMGTGYEQALIRRGSYAELFLLDLPLLRDQDATAGSGSRFYYAMDGHPSGWSEGALYSAFDTENFELEGTVAAGAVWGVALGALGDPGKPWQTDTTSTLDVRFVNGGDELESITEAALLNGGNALLVGDEIVHFANITLNGDGSYRLDTFIRGRRGTEGAMASHKVGERVILLRSGDIGRGFSALGDIDVSRRWKAVGPGRLIEDAPVTVRALSGKDLKPYAPVQISAVRSGGDLTLGWQRRTRVGGGVLNGLVPLSEAFERYELRFTHGGASVSKYVSDATEYLYSVEDFNADFDAAESAVPELDLTLYQLSETIGRGFPATETI